jgi:hypothetical protein
MVYGTCSQDLLANFPRSEAFSNLSDVDCSWKENTSTVAWRMQLDGDRVVFSLFRRGKSLFSPTDCYNLYDWPSACRKTCWQRFKNPIIYIRGKVAIPFPVTIETWLILPVVICLSQRLSHACLSISTLYCETANGSLNQL